MANKAKFLLARDKKVDRYTTRNKEEKLALWPCQNCYVARATAICLAATPAGG